MAERNLENFALFGMVATKERAISIGAIAQLQPHPSGAVTVTFVGGKEILLEQDEADQFFNSIEATVRNVKYATPQATSTRQILLH